MSSISSLSPFQILMHEFCSVYLLKFNLVFLAIEKKTQLQLGIWEFHNYTLLPNPSNFTPYPIQFVSRSAAKRIIPLCPHNAQQSLLSQSRKPLDKKSQNVSVGLGLLDKLGAQVVGSSPGAEFTNILRVQTNGLSTNLVELFTSQYDFGSVDSRWKDTKFGHISHLKARRASSRCSGGSSCGRCPLRHDKGRAYIIIFEKEGQTYMSKAPMICVNAFSWVSILTHVYIIFSYVFVWVYMLLSIDVECIDSPPEIPERPIREEVTAKPLTAEIAMARTRRKEKERMLNRCCIYVCIYVLTRWSRSYSWLGPGQSTRAIHAALVP